LNPAFETGPWSLGRWSPIIGWVAVVWACFIVVLFMLPAYAPGTFGDATFNYAPVAVLAVVAFATVTWFIGGRAHFMHGTKDEYTTKDLDDIFNEEEGHERARRQILSEEE
jgi:hypothetical protein